MADIVFSIARLGVALFLVVLNGFFVGSEFAFVRVRATSVEQLVEEGRPGSETLQHIMGHLDDYLAVTQLGITVASLGLGWAGEPAVASLIEPVLEPYLSADLIHLVSFAVGFGIITFLHVVFGELAPKTIAISDAERLSLFVAPPMKFFYYLFYPALIIFNGTANGFTSLLGFPPVSETEESLEERELRRVLARSGEQGHVDTAEVDMIERVFELDDLIAREIMVPQPDVVSVPTDATVAHLRETIREAQHTRYPVVEADDSDQVVGYIDTKDVLRASKEDDATTTAGDLAREILVVPETTTVSDLLLQFQDGQHQMAAIIDEWGAFEGIATVEDVAEAIVGDLRDDFDSSEGEPSIRKQSDGVYDIDGSVPLTVVNDELEVDFESEGFDTVGGLVLERLDRAPQAGDEVDIDGFRIEVTSVDRTRIESVRAYEDETTETDTAESSDE